MYNIKIYRQGGGGGGFKRVCGEFLPLLLLLLALVVYFLSTIFLFDCGSLIVYVHFFYVFSHGYG